MTASTLTPRRRSPATPFLRHALAPLAIASLLLTLAGCGHKNALAPEATSAPFGKAVVAAAPSQASGGAGITLDAPLHLEGEIGPGALWQIDVPQQWNGDLVVYLHGYTSPSVDVALPNAGAVISALTAQGYAVAASSYSVNGFASKEGLEQSHQLSGLFASRVATPRRTFLFGRSLGGLIGLRMSEKYPQQYAGSLLVSGVVGSARDEIDYMGDIRVLFDAVYPGVLQGDLEHTPTITSEYQQVILPVLTALQANPQGLGVIQMLARRPLPGGNSQEIAQSLITVLVFAMQGGSDFYDRTHHHSNFDNHDVRYTSPGLPPALIDDINARVARYTRTPDATAYLVHYGEPAGTLRIPVLTLHTTRDPVVPIWHELLLGQADAGDWLLQRQVARYGHDTCTLAEMMTGFADLVTWADTGQKPAF
jgi:pimeloyl-ACP methyl ester carboxylesterase